MPDYVRRQGTRRGGLMRLHISVPSKVIQQLEERRERDGVSISAIVSRLLESQLAVEAKSWK